MSSLSETDFSLFKDVVSTVSGSCIALNVMGRLFCLVNIRASKEEIIN
jgi:hypothetical protein